MFHTSGVVLVWMTELKIFTSSVQLWTSVTFALSRSRCYPSMSRGYRVIPQSFVVVKLSESYSNLAHVDIGKLIC